LADELKSYSFDELHNRLWQVAPAAWVIAKSGSSDLAGADLEDIQTLPADPDGATIVVKIKDVSRGELTIRGRVSANGNCALSQPVIVEDFGSIFDRQADKRLALVIIGAVDKRQII
jgi:hypothetical protein